MSEMGDRIVHARLSNGLEIVRYDGAGHWYQELPPAHQKRISLTQAVELALLPDAEIFLDQLGGKQFDTNIKRRLGAQ